MDGGCYQEWSYVKGAKNLCGKHDRAYRIHGRCDGLIKEKQVRPVVQIVGRHDWGWIAGAVNDEGGCQRARGRDDREMRRAWKVRGLSWKEAGTTGRSTIKAGSNRDIEGEKEPSAWEAETTCR